MKRRLSALVIAALVLACLCACTPRLSGVAVMSEAEYFRLLQEADRAARDAAELDPEKLKLADMETAERLLRRVLLLSERVDGLEAAVAAAEAALSILSARQEMVASLNARAAELLEYGDSAALSELLAEISALRPDDAAYLAETVSRLTARREELLEAEREARLSTLLLELSAFDFSNLSSERESEVAALLARCGEFEEKEELAGFLIALLAAQKTCADYRAEVNGIRKACAGLFAGGVPETARLTEVRALAERLAQLPAKDRELLVQEAERLTAAEGALLRNLARMEEIAAFCRYLSETDWAALAPGSEAQASALLAAIEALPQGDRELLKGERNTLVALLEYLNGEVS